MSKSSGHYTLTCALVILLAPFIMGGFGDHLLNYTSLSECPFQIEPIGCYADKPGYKRRVLPQQILNSRDFYSDVYQTPLIQWRNYPNWLSNFICECAKHLFQRKDVMTDYIGLQFYAECWGNLEKTLTKYDRYSASSKCIKPTYENFGSTSKCGVYIGKHLTNYVYKVSKYSASSCLELEGEHSSTNHDDISLKIDGIFISGKLNNKDIKGEIYKKCKGVLTLPEGRHTFEYDIAECELKLGNGKNFTKKNCNKGDIPCPKYTSRGCWSDPYPMSSPSKRPLNYYSMNERDPSLSNWNKRFIDWRNWGKGYLAGLLCRCAKIAKKKERKYFAIQFYGECWTGDKENYNEYGEVTTCVDDKFNVCPLETDNHCLSPICAGQWESNKVYELV